MFVKTIISWCSLFLCVVLLSLGIPACGEHRPEEPKATNLGTIQQKIINGDKNLAYPAVGTLTANKNSFCTGTLIAPRVVLTAAHCVDAFANLKGQTLEFRIDIPIHQNEYRSVFVYIDIPSSTKHPQYQGGQSALLHDVAVVILQNPVFSVAPMPYNTKAADTSWLKRDALFMGYGRLSASDTLPAPHKYSTFLTMTHLDQTDDAQRTPKPNTIGYSGQNTAVCQGDSGGPAMLEFDGKMVLVAVTSHGTSYDCSGTSYSFRTDPYVSWIQTFLDKYSTCEGTTPTCGGCATCQQKQCEPKPLTSAPQSCKVCASDADCGGGYCIQVGSGFRCVQSCDNTNCCPTGSFCTLGGNRNYCLPQSMSCPAVSCQSDKDCSTPEACVAGKCEQKLPALRKSTCQPCSQNSECGEGGYCESPDGRGGRCLQPCEGDGELCPKNFVCKERIPGLKQCTRRDATCQVNCTQDSDCLGGLVCKNNVCVRSGGNQVGEPCHSGMPCQSELQCIPSSAGARCYQTCGFAAGSAGAPCRPGNICDRGLQCYPNPLGSGNFCVQPCQTVASCTDGGTCFPGINLCTCQTDSQCTNGGKCNVIIQGVVGVCSAGKETTCPSGEECASSPGQPSICVQTGSGNRTSGQACDNLNRCQSGNLCVPGLNRCVESCNGGKVCQTGGSCRTLLGPDEFCLCSADSECKGGRKCQILAQNIGYCSEPVDAGCKENTCPSGFVCQNKVCVVKTENLVESVQEQPGEMVHEHEASALDAGHIQEGQGVDSNNPENTTQDLEPPAKPCGCDSQGTQTPTLAWILLLFLGYSYFRFRRLRGWTR